MAARENSNEGKQYVVRWKSCRYISPLQGYLNNPAATSNAITADKWFKTGDVAIRDQEGHFYIVDRLKELIKYKVGMVHLLVINLLISEIGIPRYDPAAIFS
jgi:acyl-CoA synthetase (AMP-forming)/AMP-acid ligase II